MHLPDPLTSRLNNAKDAIDRYIARYAQVGTILRWKTGKHKGRRAKVIRVYWDDWPSNMCVKVGVDTERHDKRGWMESDRHYYVLAENFEQCEGETTDGEIKTSRKRGS